MEEFPNASRKENPYNLINTFIENSRYALTWEQIDL